MADLYQYSSGANVLDQTKTISIPEHLKDQSALASKKDAHTNSFRRYLPILTFDLVSLTLVLLTCYELVSDKLLKGLAVSDNYLMNNIDKVILYASLVLIVLALFLYTGLYVHHVIQTRTRQLFYIFKSFFYADVIIIVFAFFFINSQLSETFKEFIIWFTVSGVFFTFSGRMLFRYLIKNNKSLSTLKPPRRLVVIGAGEAAKLYIANLINEYNSVEDVLFLDDDENKHGSNIFGFPIEGRVEDVAFRAAAFKADEICIVINKVGKERLLELVHYATKSNLPVKVSSTHYNLMFTGMYDSRRNTLETIPMDSQVHQKLDLIYKRILDVMGSIVLGLIALVPCIIIALLIKLTSKGPIFHSSYRVGKEGTLFRLYKFRSMRVNGGEHHVATAIGRLSNGYQTGKIANDPRITPFGRFLRKYCLDELPQLINVLKGEMSLVGPRPCFKYEMEMFEKWQYRRFLMKPGITGLWQVTGRQREEMLLNDAMSTDVFYTDHYSIWMDFRILLKTIPVVAAGTGR